VSRRWISGGRAGPGHGQGSAEADAAELVEMMISVRFATQRNTGRKTAGIDGQVALTSQARARRQYARSSAHGRLPGPAGVHKFRKPAVRLKCGCSEFPDLTPSGTRSATPEPAGGPVPNSVPAGSGRVAGCHDAVESCSTLCGKRRVWILMRTLAGAFDKSTMAVCCQHRTFPAREMIRDY